MGPLRGSRLRTVPKHEGSYSAKCRSPKNPRCKHFFGACDNSAAADYQTDGLHPDQRASTDEKNYEKADKKKSKNEKDLVHNYAPGTYRGKSPMPMSQASNIIGTTK